MDSTLVAQVWTGRVLSGIAIAFLFVDAFAKLMRIEPVKQGASALGWDEHSVFALGVILMIGTVLYAIPRTAVIGAIYITGFLGGALATHLRVGSPLLTHVLFSVYVGAFVWGGLALRNAQLRSVLLGH